MQINDFILLLVLYCLSIQFSLSSLATNSGQVLPRDVLRTLQVQYNFTLHIHLADGLCICGSKGAPIRPCQHHGFREGPAPPAQAAEGIVKGRWIMEISRVFFRYGLAN